MTGSRATARGLVARRRAEQVAARRARLLGVVLLLAVVGGGAGGLAWAWDSGGLDARAVVVGHERTPVASVHERLTGVTGTPLPLVDPADVEQRVAGLPLVRSVRVERRWPRTLVVELAEREPVAAVAEPTWLGDRPGGEAGLTLVDAEGVVLGVLAPGEEPPEGLPVVAADLAEADAVASVAAARAAGEGLSPALRARTTAVEARSPHDVRLVVDGRDVRWGGAADAEAKAAVLVVLLAEVDAEVYDVSAPRAPAARGGGAERG